MEGREGTAMLGTKMDAALRKAFAADIGTGHHPHEREKVQVQARQVKSQASKLLLSTQIQNSLPTPALARRMGSFSLELHVPVSLPGVAGSVLLNDSKIRSY